MINQISGLNNRQISPSSLELEFLAALLETEDETYPWNPADQESEAYFLQLEQQFECDNLLGEELTRRSDDFYQNLDTLWSHLSSEKTDHDEQPSKSIKVSLHEALHEAFAAVVPTHWLNTIAEKAAEIARKERSVSEKLVECVQCLLPDWEADDLLVLARPYAYAMRSNEQQNLTGIINNIENREWTGLSEIEQAKICLAIANYTFKELSSLEPES
ncbi:MAG: hypothetical protein EAZ76_15250 [Nostocales cyanobacterium]|nr:MAG: hypothetical protein EAZ87_22675 [Nostocales cyanobacterium]TAF11145.1 MAG: hypothetical protein EAZ76_15250 [Nostocales cyanobacterium]